MRITTCFASRDEQKRRMPADSIVPDPMATLTNAITIDAPPAQVWPWIVQLGAGRAGWYSHDWIDNDGHPSATTILPEHQRLTPGGIVPAVPGARDAFIVSWVEPARNLVLIVPNGAKGRCRVSWEYLLDPIPPDRTRLIVRGRVSQDWLTRGQGQAPSPNRQRFIERVYGLLARLPRPIMLLAARSGHRVMLARHLRGIRRRAERSDMPSPGGA
jgi:hypothetical protein